MPYDDPILKVPVGYFKAEEPRRLRRVGPDKGDHREVISQRKK